MTAFVLKVIALASMILDHLAVVFPDYFPFWLRGIGRLAWPIFAFLLAEGFKHTKSPEKFLLRLLAFALISEVPYDLAMGNDISFIADTNIFYTLFLGGMAICQCEKMKKWRGVSTMATLGALLPAALLAEILTAEYGGMGVLLIFAAYAIKPKGLRIAVMSVFALSQFIPLVPAHFLSIEIRLEYWLMVPFTLAAMLLIANYNGKRGTPVKWLFYLAYPAHLVVLAAIAAIVSGFT